MSKKYFDFQQTFESTKVTIPLSSSKGFCNVSVHCFERLPFTVLFCSFYTKAFFFFFFFWFFFCLFVFFSLDSRFFIFFFLIAVGRGNKNKIMTTSESENLLYKKTIGSA